MATMVHDVASELRMLTGRGPRALWAPRGRTLHCKTWQAEAALRMLLNNLDPEVAERP
ncbi:MAG: hypothetical protein KDA05_06935, partial [Phycisphaerales bacterium]|nr:hypothetical protein [Phycisphaerales bacterium]